MRPERKPEPNPGPRPGRRNCWDVMQCGRGPDHPGTACPAARSGVFGELNQGEARGRFCWAVAGTFSHGAVHCAAAHGLDSCLDCRFLQQVAKEEGPRFILHAPWRRTVDDLA